MKRLTEDKMRKIVYGSSWYGTGGGFPLSRQMRELSRYSPVLCSVQELGADAMVCCAYGLGSAAKTEVSLQNAFKEAVRILEARLQRCCKAIFPAEINIEAAIFDLATDLDIAVLDADTCGGRAVPELKFDNFTLLHRSIAPVIAVDTELNSLIIEKYEEINEVELRLRDFALQSAGGAIAVVDHAISGAEAKATLSLGTLSRSMRVGEAIARYKLGQIQRNDLLNIAQACIIVDRGRVIDSNLEDRGGFFQGRLEISDGHKVYEVIVQNELMRLLSEGISISEFPELIVPVNPDSMLGLHSTEVALGMELTLLKIEPAEIWRSAFK